MNADERGRLASELDDLAGGWGVPADVQYAVDHLHDSLVADVGYDFSVGVGLLLGDLAAVVEASDGGEGDGS